MPAGYLGQAALIGRVRAQALAFDKEFGDHRKGMADATGNFFDALEKFGDEATQLELDELRNHLELLSRSKKTSSQTGDLYDPAVIFETYNHPAVAQTIRETDLVSRRLSGTPLPALHQEFYKRASATLTQIKNLHSTSEARTHPNFGKIWSGQISYMVRGLRWEAEALGVSPNIVRGLDLIRHGSAGYNSTRLDSMIRTFKQLVAPEVKSPPAANE